MRTVKVFIAAMFVAAAAAMSLAQPEVSDPNDPLEAELVDPNASSADADQNRPLDDYEASEQISEDLSVAFPVDI